MIREDERLQKEGKRALGKKFGGSLRMPWPTYWQQESGKTNLVMLKDRMYMLLYCTIISI